MPKILQVTVEFSLDVLSESGFPLVLLRKARFLRFLRQDTYGFQISYQVRTAEVPQFKKKLRERYEAVIGVKTLHRNDKDGLETLFIQGRWITDRSPERRDRAAKTLRSLFDCQRYLLRSPQVVREKLRISIGREQSRMRKMLAKFNERKVPYRVAKLAEVEG